MSGFNVIAGARLPIKATQKDDPMLEDVPPESDGLTTEERKYYRLCHPGGPGGIMLEKPELREQDKEAQSAEGYAVVFFPKISRLSPATMNWPRVSETISQTPEAAIVKFMDGLAKSCTWERYHDAGHRVRKVRLVDLGDAETGNLD